MRSLISCLFTPRPPGSTSKKSFVHSSPMLSGPSIFLSNSAFIHFSSIAKSSFSNAAFPALGWVFSCVRTGSGIQASTHKISTHAYFIRLYLLVEVNSISFAGNKPRDKLPAVIDLPNKNTRRDRSTGCHTTGGPGHPEKIRGGYFPNAGRDIRSPSRYLGRGIQVHPCNTMRTKSCRSCRRQERMGSAARRAVGIP